MGAFENADGQQLHRDGFVLEACLGSWMEALPDGRAIQGAVRPCR